ncbi:hypothetical protein TNCV_3976681 [Trichonephila clavipes]|nr:hypothetical protein TNCV_3976681 [Trichonephila clavipes]
MKFEENRSVSESQFKNQKHNNVHATIFRIGFQTLALFREPELKSGALRPLGHPDFWSKKHESGVRTHALFREPELKSGASDRSPIRLPEPRNTRARSPNSNLPVCEVYVWPMRRRVNLTSVLRALASQATLYDRVSRVQFVIQLLTPLIPARD